MVKLLTLGTIGLRATGERDALSVLAQPKRFAVFVYLALTGRDGFVRRDSLLAMFWPDSDRRHARNSLSQALHFLRRELGSDLIRNCGAEAVGVAAERIWCDSLAFRKAIRAGEQACALDLYGGELLPGLHVDGAPDFERWLSRSRNRLTDGAVRAAWHLAEDAFERSDCSAVSSYVRRAVGLRPHDESALCRALELLDRIGDRAGAIRAYEEFARVLAAEYGLEPAAETGELVGRIRGRKGC